MASKSELKGRLQAYLHSHMGEVTDPWVVDELKRLLTYSQAEKMEGFERFVIKRNPMGSNSFYVVNGRGTDDFSYNWVIRCYSPLSKRVRNPKHITEMIGAARNSIRDQILEYRLSVNGKEEEVVDHYPTSFSQLLHDWYGKQPQAVVPLRQEESLMWYLAEPFESSWKDYHRANAGFRMLPRVANGRNGSYGFKADWLKLVNEKRKRESRCLLDGMANKEGA